MFNIFQTLLLRLHQNPHFRKEFHFKALKHLKISIKNSLYLKNFVLRARSFRLELINEEFVHEGWRKTGIQYWSFIREGKFNFGCLITFLFYFQRSIA